IAGFRHRCLDRVAAENPLEGIIAFGAAAADALDQWPASSGLPVFRLPHPAANDALVAARWSAELEPMAAAIAPDPGAAVDLAPYTPPLGGADAIPIPAADLPFGVPAWQAGGGSHSTRDGNERIVWIAPGG